MIFMLLLEFMLMHCSELLHIAGRVSVFIIQVSSNLRQDHHNGKYVQKINSAVAYLNVVSLPDVQICEYHELRTLLSRSLHLMLKVWV